MKQDIEQYVKGCATCQASKINRQPLKPAIFPITPENPLPFQTVAMDFITKLPLAGGYDTILTITDHDCSKAAIFIPCNETITAEGVAALYLRHVYPRFGIPKKIITDRDTRFTSKFGQGLNKALGIQSNMSTAYHPQTDGQSERTNQELEIFIRSYCYEEQNKWDKWLPAAEFAHNQRPNATTKKTPFELIMGYNPSTEWITRPIPVPQVEERLAELVRIRQVAQEAMIKAQNILKLRRPGNKNFRPYEEGDQVWIEGTNLKTLYPSAKLSPKRYGPFKVLKRLSNAVYQIDTPRHWKVHNVFHANLITPYKETELHGPNFARPSPELVEGEEEYEVEKILDMKPRGRGRKMHFLIKWKGYPTSDNSWEPEENLHAEELVQQFKEKQRRTNKTKAKRT